MLNLFYVKINFILHTHNISVFKRLHAFFIDCVILILKTHWQTTNRLYSIHTYIHNIISSHFEMSFELESFRKSTSENSIWCWNCLSHEISCTQLKLPPDLQSILKFICRWIEFILHFKSEIRVVHDYSISRFLGPNIFEFSFHFHIFDILDQYSAKLNENETHENFL